jgi:hypothetical protein
MPPRVLEMQIGEPEHERIASVLKDPLCNAAWWVPTVTQRSDSKPSRQKAATRTSPALLEKESDAAKWGPEVARDATKAKRTTTKARRDVCGPLNACASNNSSLIGYSHAAKDSAAAPPRDWSSNSGCYRGPLCRVFNDTDHTRRKAHTPQYTQRKVGQV